MIVFRFRRRSLSIFLKQNAIDYVFVNWVQHLLLGKPPFLSQLQTFYVHPWWWSQLLYDSFKVKWSFIGRAGRALDI